MTERCYDQDTLQCSVKVKELQNAYHKAQEANRRPGATPASCQLYKELDAILSGNPTSTAKATADILVTRMPIESGPSQEEEILDEDVEGEGDPEAEDDSEVRDACSQELFSTPEEASQSQLLELGEAQTGEEAPGICLRDLHKTLMEILGSLLLQVLWQICFVSCPIKAEQLRKIRKQPQRTKEDFLHDVIMHSAAENQELKEWRDSEKRDRKENAAHQNEATERLLKHYGTPSGHAPGATSTANLAAPHPPSPAAAVAKLFAMRPPDTANTLLSTSWLQAVPAAFHSSPVTVQHCGLSVPTALNTQPSAV
ncbi:hypothetical protein UY3_00195 [Chelonia mydas]|uniref:Uncharacterized protein n=1 Tax=Chelonia mydas TaxID=8469 RepID=M7BXD7_CHEMY|nr:hypothetical protein UY3_00195 [Chelonia mydas]